MKRFTLVVVAVVCAAMVFGCSQRTKGGGTKAPTKLAPIYFDLDKSNIRADQEGTLKNNVTVLKNAASSKVTISGNCDERGSVEYNIALGDRRANSAKGYMVKAGITGDRISTISYGKEKPSCKEHNEACWSKNRRDDFDTK